MALSCVKELVVDSPWIHSDRPSAALIALRRASWPFADALIRSERFEFLLSRLGELEEELAAHSRVLVDRLHSLVPQAQDAATRGQLLRLKRLTFNGRPLPKNFEGRCSSLLSSTKADLVRYSSLLCERNNLMAESCADIAAELTNKLTLLAARIDFRLAIEASSHTLLSALERNDRRDRSLTPKDLRSLYAYVCRFTTKANPLHLFTHLIPGRAMMHCAPLSGSKFDCEIIFDVRWIRALERRLFALPLDSTRVRLELRPLVREGNAWRLWFKRNQGDD